MTRDEALAATFKDIYGLLQLLREDYVVIPKEEVRQVYKGYQNDLVRFAGSGDTFRIRTKAIMAALERIFGPELFNDLKQ